MEMYTHSGHTHNDQTIFELTLSPVSPTTHNDLKTMTVPSLKIVTILRFHISVSEEKVAPALSGS